MPAFSYFLIATTLRFRILKINGMRAVSLKIPVQLPGSLCHRKVIVRFGEMIHPDMHVTGTRQSLDRAFEERELGVRRWQLGFADAHLRLEQMRHMTNEALTNVRDGSPSRASALPKGAETRAS